MKVDVDSLIELIKKNVYENHRQDVTAIMVQDAVSAVAENIGVSVNQLYDNLGEHIEFITKEVDKKLEKVYVDGTSIQGDGTKENPKIGRASCRERV